LSFRIQLLAAYAANPLVAARVVPCLNATADSFYSSQGRTDANFDDRNETLIDEIIAKFPAATTLEMETFQLCALSGLHCALWLIVSYAYRS
jgi:uridine phosphorylase